MSQPTDSFEVLDLVSGGHDSDVYLIRSLANTSLYLLKRLRGEQSKEKQVLDRRVRFAKEMSLVASLDHPGIAKPVSAQNYQGEPAIIYPYRKGRTLASIIEHGALFPPNDAIRLIIPILESLDYIHSRGIVHCDLNPHNIFVDDHLNVQIFDFGLALTEEEAARQPEGHIRGTPPFLSPEQTGLTRLKIDARSDLFCAALILYRLISGRLPFPVQYDTLMDLFDAILKRDMDPLRGIPAQLNAILLKSLRHSPDGRYQTASGFSHDLRLAMDECSEHQAGFQVGVRDAEVAVNRLRLFVGRENEVDTLLVGLSGFRSKSRPWSALIHGPSGIGKTEIVTEFRRRSGEGDFVFISVKCNRFTPHQPYSVIRHFVLEMLNAITRDPSGNVGYRDAGKDLQPSSGVICRSIPEMRSFFDQVEAIDEVQKEREAERTVHVLVQMMISLLRIRPIVFFVDDLQWIDQASYVLLKRIRSQECSHAFVACYRTEEANQELLVHGEAVCSLGFDHILAIRPFTKKDITEYLQSRFGRIEQINVLADALIDRTDGKPFTLTEACRWLVTSGVLLNADRGWRFECLGGERLPAQFDPVSLVLEKTRDLDSAPLHFLRVASLIEGGFDLKVIANAIEMDVEAARGISRDLEHQGFLRGKLDGDFSFTHDRIQESIAAQMAANDKHRYYGVLTEVYEQLSKEDREYIFDAAECSLKGADIAKAAQTCCKAGEYAGQTIASEVAIRYYSRAVLLAKECLKTGNPPLGVNLPQIEIALGDLLTLTGRNEQALDLFERFRESPSDRDSFSRTEILYRIGAIHHSMGMFEKSIAVLKEALHSLGARLPESPWGIAIELLSRSIQLVVLECGLKRVLPQKRDPATRLKAKIYNKLTYSLYFYNMFACLLANLRAMTIAERLGNCFEKAEAYTSHLVPLYQLFLRGRLAGLLRRTQKVLSRIRRPDAEAFHNTFVGIVHYFRAQFATGKAYLEKSNSAYAAMGDVSGTILNLEHLWRIELQKGDLPSASEYISKTKMLCYKTKEKHFLAATLAAEYWIRYIRDGKRDNARLEEIAGILSSCNSFLTHTHVAAFLIEIKVLCGEIPEAHRQIRALAKDIILKSFNSEYIVPFFVLFCEIILRDRRADNDHALPRRYADYAYIVANLFLGFSTLSYPVYRGSWIRCRAKWHALHGHKRRAQRLFQRAIQSHHGLGMKYEEAKSLRDYADFLDSCGSSGQASDNYTQAYIQFRRCGAKLDMDLIAPKADPNVIKEAISEAPVEPKEEQPALAAFSMSSEIDRIRLETLHNLSATMSTVEETSELLKQVLAAQMRVTGARYGTLFLDSQDNHEATALAMDFEGRNISSSEMFYSPRVLEQVKTGKVILGSTSDEANSACGTDVDQVHSVMCIPLTKAGKYLGCIYLANDTVGGLFTEGARKAAQILAAQAAILIENARLIERYRALAHNLEHTVREQTESLTEKNRQLESNTVKLLESERIKSLLTGALVHDIKNAATGISGTLFLLGKRGDNDPRTERMIRFSNAACSDIVNFSSNLLDITRMEEGKLAVKPMPLGVEWLREIFEKNRSNPSFDEKSIILRFEQPLHDVIVTADKYLLERVLHNLFNNAAKYVPEQGEVVLSMSTDDQSETLTLFTTGAPIPDDFKDRIFEKYSRVNQEHSPYSKGLGLFFCRTVLNAHRGRIWLETDARGNYFKMSFPHVPVVVQMPPGSEAAAA